MSACLQFISDCAHNLYVGFQWQISFLGIVQSSLNIHDPGFGSAGIVFFKGFPGIHCNFLADYYEDDGFRERVVYERKNSLIMFSPNFVVRIWYMHSFFIRDGERRCLFFKNVSEVVWFE